MWKRETTAVNLNTRVGSAAEGMLSRQRVEHKGKTC